MDKSSGCDTKSVVNSYSQTLLAANIAFCGLHRYMPEEKLDLLKLASRIMAESRTGPSGVGGSNPLSPTNKFCRISKLEGSLRFVQNEIWVLLGPIELFALPIVPRTSDGTE